MMRLDEIIDQFIALIKENEYFEDIRAIKAYPCTDAPVRISRATVALGVERIDMSSVSVDESNRAGEVSVFADIFVPLKSGSDKAQEIFLKLCSCLSGYNILSVSAERIAVDVNTSSYVLKTAFTFNDEIEVV
jgi:hypothetical protein